VRYELNGLLDRHVRIGVSGEEGSFSAKAALGWAAENGMTDFQIVHLVEIEPVLAAIAVGGQIDLGVFPLFNNSVGLIEPALDAIEKYNFCRIDKVPLLVEQCLLARKGVTVEQILTITSQGPAIEQCQRRLHRHWRHVDIDLYSDTAKAAHDLANGILPATTAVIASRDAARIYGLNVLEKPFQDDAENMTAFLVVKQRIDAM